MNEGKRPGFVYSSVEDWYINLLAPAIERRLDATGAGTLTWCPQRWQQPGAIARLEALWRAWEVCRDADGEAPSRWFWQHCDPMLAALMDAKAAPYVTANPTNTANTPTPPRCPANLLRSATGAQTSPPRLSRCANRQYRADDAR